MKKISIVRTLCLLGIMGGLVACSEGINEAENTQHLVTTKSEHQIEILSDNSGIERFVSSKTMLKYNLNEKDAFEFKVIRHSGVEALIVETKSNASHDTNSFLVLNEHLGVAYEINSRNEGGVEKIEVHHLGSGKKVIVTRDIKGHIQLTTPPDQIGGTAAAENCWEDCMETAFEACFDDWECTVECGLVFNYCVAAVALSCAISCNN